MFDREKQIVINRICKNIFSTKPLITIGEFNLLEIPTPIKRYINFEFESRIISEFNEIKKFSRFNYNHPRVKPIVSELQVLLKLTREVNENEMSILLKSALDLTIDFLLMPIEVLTSFLFSFMDRLTKENIIFKLNYISDYEYFPQIIKKYFERVEGNFISREEFKNLLQKIDHEYTRNFTLLEHYELFKRFREYLSELELNITDQAEFEGFIIFLKDKNYNDAVNFLEENRSNFTSQKLNLREFIKSLIEPKVIQESQKVEVVESEYSNSNITDQDEAFSTSIVEEDTNSNKEISQPSEPTPQMNETELQEKDQDGEKTIDKNVLYEKLVSKPDLETKVLNRKLELMMPARFYKKVLKKIFDGNENEFMEFMNQINKSKNWDEASYYLTDLFDRKNIQPFSKWAIRFVNFLYEKII